MTNQSEIIAEALRELLRDYEAAVEREADGGPEWFWVDEIKSRIRHLDKVDVFV